jgi:hypothetical protein
VQSAGRDAPDVENVVMSQPANPQEFWVATIIDWITKNSGVRKEGLDLKRKFTEEPYNLSVVKVLNLMDELVALNKSMYKTDLVLAQNWRLAHRGDTVGDFIVAFLEVVSSEDAGRVKRTGIS